jgi:hypothetical protein
MLKNIPISESYRSAVRMALIISLIFGVMSALVLDGGELARLTGIALAVFWGAVAVIMLRRPRNPTSFDLFLIRYGCGPLIIGFWAAISFVWRWRGLI